MPTASEIMMLKNSKTSLGRPAGMVTVACQTPFVSVPETRVIPEYGVPTPPWHPLVPALPLPPIVMPVGDFSPPSTSPTSNMSQRVSPNVLRKTSRI